MQLTKVSELLFVVDVAMIAGSARNLQQNKCNYDNGLDETIMKMDMRYLVM